MRKTTVQGVEYEVWGDFFARATFAKNVVTGEIKRISSSGYISNDLTVRKAIAVFFNHVSFRK